MCLYARHHLDKFQFFGLPSPLLYLAISPKPTRVFANIWFLLKAALSNLPQLAESSPACAAVLQREPRYLSHCNCFGDVCVNEREGGRGIGVCICVSIFGWAPPPPLSSSHLQILVPNITTTQSAVLFLLIMFLSYCFMPGLPPYTRLLALSSLLKVLAARGRFRLWKCSTWR